MFVHLLRPDGSLAAQSDSRPRDGEYPTYLWLPGETVSDTRSFTLPGGDYVLEVGLYLPDSGERLGTAILYTSTVP